MPRRTPPPRWALLASLLTAALAACRTPEPPQPPAPGETRTLHSLGLRSVDVLVLAETIGRDVAGVLQALPEGSAPVRLELQNDAALPQGSWRALSGALVREVMHACADRGVTLFQGGAPARHRLALAVGQTGSFDDRELIVAYRVDALRLDAGSAAPLAQAQLPLRSMH